MNKFLALCATVLVTSTTFSMQRELSPAEQERCQCFYDKLGECYNEVLSQPEVVTALQCIADSLQKVADENRADFEAVRDIMGAKLQDGTAVLPLNMPFFLQ